MNPLWLITTQLQLPTKLDDTLALAKLIENTGVSALGLHGRTQHERNRDHNHNDIIKVIAQNVSIPVIAKFVSDHILLVCLLINISVIFTDNIFYKISSNLC